MGTDKVKEYLANFGLADRVMEFKESSAEAAADLGCEPARIGKTMAFDVAGQPMLVVIAGDGKVDNAKYKAKFHCKACMIKPDELVVKVGHPMGGVCPFAVCPGVPVYAAEEDVLTNLTGFHLTRGMLCAMRRPKLQSVEDVCRDARRVVVLENVMNPTNIGAIFRSAAALGMDAVLLTTAGSDPLYRRASRVSMGNVFLIPWTYLPESGDWTQLLRNLGFRTVAMALRNDSVRLDDPRLAAEEKLAIVMGTEGDGLASSTIASCDYTVRIPMYHGVDSLNVAAASAVAFYELGLPPLNEKED